MDIMPMDTTMARGPLMPSPRLRLRLTQPCSMALMVTLTVWDTTLAMLDMLATPTLMEPESPPPTLPVESPPPPTLVSAPTTSEPSSPARQSV